VRSMRHQGETSQHQGTLVSPETTDSVSVRSLWEQMWSLHAGESDEHSGACRLHTGVHAAVERT
jgi:hypothetical protein